MKFLLDELEGKQRRGESVYTFLPFSALMVASAAGQFFLVTATA